MSAAIPAGAKRAVVILTAMNLLNYADRYVPSVVKDLYKADLGLTDAETSLPLTAFVFVYMLASPIFGSMADRFSRRGVIAFGVALWSLATGLAAFATGFWTLLAARAFVGVGEAAYATLSPALLSDFYPPDRRNKILTIFYVAIPVGSAIGFALGGWLGQAYGWRTAFMVVGFPGLFAALAVLWVPEPGRGTYDADKGATPPSWPKAVKDLLSNRTYAYAVGGYVLVTFASGALADWYPAFVSRERGLDLAEAGLVVGVATVVGGLGGTMFGGFLADWLRARRPNGQPYLMVSWITMALAASFCMMALFVEGKWAIGAVITFAQLFLWCYNAPINTLIVNSVPSALRARAVALSILLIHLFGDAISPPIVAYVGNLPGSSLLIGLALVPIAMVGGATVWAVGARRMTSVAGRATSEAG